MRTSHVATDYDEVRSDVKETQENSLEALQSANAPDARSVVQELDEADGLDGAGVPGGEFIAEELIVQVIPQADDEFTCSSCFLVRHRSQIARQVRHRYLLHGLRGLRDRLPWPRPPARERGPPRGVVPDRPSQAFAGLLPFPRTGTKVFQSCCGDHGRHSTTALGARS